MKNETLTIFGKLVELEREGVLLGLDLFLATDNIENDALNSVFSLPSDTIVLAEFLEEQQENLAFEEVSIRYWISEINIPMTEIKRISAEEMCGISEAIYCVYYSEITGYLWTDEKFCVGGHDLINELKSFTNQYLLLEIDF